MAAGSYLTPNYSRSQKYENPVSGTLVTHVGASVARMPRIIDTAAKLNPSTGSHRQSEGEETRRQNYRLVSAYMAPQYKEIPAIGECTRSAMEKLQSAAH
ncbi:hypothetical protein TNCV_112241 [Trichonephila clavipes]|nr:hypothetical protein TNCV_112241 [Trichonephila clavipes]